jgi:hypothetical protein
VTVTSRHRRPGFLRRLTLRLTEHTDRMLADMARELSEQAELKRINARRAAI